MRQEDADELTSYIDTHRPIIYINYFDFHAVDGLIAQVNKDIPVYEYNEAGRHVDFKTKAPKGAIERSGNLAGFLTAFDDNKPRKAFLVLKDAHHYFQKESPSYSPEIIALLKSIAQRIMYTEGYYVTVFLVCSELALPPELEKMITVFDIPFPTIDEIETLIKKEYAECIIDENTINELTVSFKGLSDFEIRQILNLAYQRSGMITAEDKILVLKEKEQIIKKSGILEIVPVNSTMDDVGGLSNLKKYLRDKSYIFNNLGEARQFGIDLPKGILIVGMPGCGKSLTAKATANQFNVPLLRLDIGKLMGKYVGESEENLSRAIKTAEAVAPCVLWIDELEKAFAGVGGSGGASDITTRLFGQFLTWLQEKESSVYVVATSNKLNALPPEFKRKGRFDELFLVELPNAQERRKIFEIHLGKRKKLTGDVNVIPLLKETEGYSGADIEAVVKETIEGAFISDDKTVTTDKLLNTIKNTKSISITLKEEIEALTKEYEKYNLKQATPK
ncbi:MAG: AAA family ATPase [Spirochaetaceae bacterium]|jgi:ATP-dependent 26S proteasome regulatory subunit|nr:AAA family ATPase [Spirochaetaceae bacterium]